MNGKPKNIMPPVKAVAAAPVNYIKENVKSNMIT